MPIDHRRVGRVHREPWEEEASGQGWGGVRGGGDGAAHPVCHPCGDIVLVDVNIEWFGLSAVKPGVPHGLADVLLDLNRRMKHQEVVGAFAHALESSSRRGKLEGRAANNSKSN